MELRDVLRKRFPSLTLTAAIEISRARGACADGSDWLEQQPDTETALRDAPTRFVSWFAAPFLRGVNLREADLSGAILSGADLSGVYHDEFTQWPAGYAQREEL